MSANSYTVINPDSGSPLVLTCEHASAKIPAAYNNLGLPDSAFQTHIARDFGCAELTAALAGALNCTAFLGNWSRLLIDLNRREEEAELIVQTSDGIAVPGNRNLNAEEKEYRLTSFYRPYHQAIEDKLTALRQLNKKPRLFSIHAFTPQLQGGKFRPWNAGILFLEPTPLSRSLLARLSALPGLKTEANQPYDLRQYKTGSSVIHGAENHLDNALIEIRDSEFADIEQGVKNWCSYLLPALR